MTGRGLKSILEGKRQESSRYQLDFVLMKLDHCRDTGYRYASAPEGDPNAICPAFQRVFCHPIFFFASC